MKDRKNKNLELTKRTDNQGLILVHYNYMTKKIFVTGAVYDLAVLPLATVQQQVQLSLDNLTGGRVQFQIQQISNNELELTFHRGFSYASTFGQNIIYELDAEIITGYGLPGFILPVQWHIPCRRLSNQFNFYIPINDFLPCYRKTARILKASRAKNIQLDIQPTYIKMRLLF